MPQVRRPWVMVLCLLVALSSFLIPKPAAAEPFVSPEQIEVYLRANHSPMVEGPLAAPGIGRAFVIHGLAYNVDPRLILGIANAESSLGKNLCNSFNAWGWLYGKNPETQMKDCAHSPLLSWEAGIRAVTQDIAFKYLGQGPMTIAEIGRIYCDPTRDPTGCGENAETWVGNVLKVYNNPLDLTPGLGGDPTELTFSPNTRFSDNVEGSVTGWSATGFWHVRENPEQVKVVDAIFPRLVTLHDTVEAPRFTYVQGFLPPAYSRTRAWWYGEDATGTYIGADFASVPQAPKNGGTSARANNGDLITPTIDLTGLPGSSKAFLVFQTWWEIESVDADVFDILGEGIRIEVSVGASFQRIGILNPPIDVNGHPDIPYVSGWYGFEPFDPGKPGQPIWTPVGVDLSQYVGTKIRIRFRFETRDSLFNGFRGWLIDDIAVFVIPQ